MNQTVTDILCNDVARILVALTLIVGTFVVLLSGREVPSVLWALDSSAATFYFTVSILKDQQLGR